MRHPFLFGVVHDIHRFSSSRRIRRDLDVLTSSPSHGTYLSSYSYLMNTSPLPPGLRFPSSFILGRDLVVQGTAINATSGKASFAIWSLDLGHAGLDSVEERGTSLSWRELETGGVLKRGTWGHGLLWRNSLVVLGNDEGDPTLDYSKRQVIGSSCPVGLCSFRFSNTAIVCLPRLPRPGR